MDIVMTTTQPATPTPAKVAVRCNECGRKWKVSPNAATLECARCGGCDIDPID
jgi:hypothetical protein